LLVALRVFGDPFVEKPGDREYEVSYCVGHENGNLDRKVCEVIEELGLTHSVDRHGGSTNIKRRVQGRHLHMLCGAFEDGAANKRLPEILFGLEGDFAAGLIDGYRAADGTSQQCRPSPRGQVLEARWKIASVSLQLLGENQDHGSVARNARRRPRRRNDRNPLDRVKNLCCSSPRSCVGMQS
jgi:hypothetical protein